MVSSAEIIDLKRIVAKNPKSLAFAWLADMLREASSGDKQKLDEALLTANNGLDVNPNFLPGRLARGRILLEKGDLAGAKEDFMAVAERDLFCSSAQKLFLETSEKLGQPPETEIYQKILGMLEPGVVVKVKAKPKTESTGVNAALDDLLDEDDNAEDKEDIEISGLLLQTFENIFEPGKQEQPAKAAPPPAPKAAPPPAPKAAPPPAPKAAPPPAPKAAPPPAPKAAPPAPDIDALIKEQLVSKVDNVPDLTSDMDSLLASASALPPVSGALSPPSPPKAAPSPPKAAPSPPKAAPSPPDIDAIIKEQLSSKMENLPDLTGDMDSLLASAKDVLSASGTLTAPSTPDIDAIIKEQLSSKIENAPDLTNDINSLLESAPALEPSLSASYSLPPTPDAPKSSSTPKAAPSPSKAPSTPDIDAIIKEQLASKVEDVPDLTGDINSLLESNTPKPPSQPSKPDIDAIVKEQLASKVENVPDLTGDINSLLESNTPKPPSQPIKPDIDAIVKEQLASKVEDVPDLTGDINSLLESMPLSDSDVELTPYVPSTETEEAEPELMPYVPPTKKTDSMIAQKPTMTLAELYMDQGLPQEAVEVYKELLAQDPNNVDLKEKLALAEAQM